MRCTMHQLTVEVTATQLAYKITSHTLLCNFLYVFHSA